MLDQNTDRMWYVIGAVIIGAALIFIMNGAFPQLFASVGGTFEDKVDDVSTVVDDLTMTDGVGSKKRTDGINLLKYGALTVEGGHYVAPDGSINPYIVESSDRSEFLRHEDLAPIFESNGMDQTYMLSFDIKSKDTSKYDKAQVYMQSGSGSKYIFVHNTFTVSEEWQTITLYGLKAEINPKNAALEKPYETAHLAFWGTYNTGNVPVVKDIRLEREVMK